MTRLALALAVVAAVVFAPGPRAGAASDAIFEVRLSGGTLVPGPGDPDGSGEATIYVDGDTNRLCAHIRVRGIAPATAAHIHFGAAGQNGGHAVDLLPPSNGSVFYCTTANPPVLDAMTAAPQNFYLNVHNEPYPLGALRGQLAFA